MKKLVNTKLAAQVNDWLAARDRRPRPVAEGRPRAQFVPEPQNAAVSAPELLLYDEIGCWGCTAADVAYALDGYNGDLHVRINSPGGDVFDGYAIYNMLASLDGTVTVTVEGLAASAASFIAMAGDEVRVQLASQMMIHDASGLCIGNAEDMAGMCTLLNSVSDTIAAVYANRAGGDPAGWRATMRAEQWYTPQEAVDAGLADQILNPKAPAPPEEAVLDPMAPPAAEPAARWDLTVFQYAGRGSAPAPVVVNQAPEPEAPAEPDEDDGEQSEEQGAEEPAAPDNTPTETAPEPVPEPPAPADAWADAINHLTAPSADGWAASVAHLIERSNA